MLMFSIVIAVGLPAAGAGGPGNQGTRFAGEGLDETTHVIGGGFQSKGVQVFSLNVSEGFSALPTKFVPVITSSLSNYYLSSVQCTRDEYNVRLAKCTAVVKSTLSPSSVCGQPTTPEQVTKLVAINAGWDDGKAALDFSVKGKVVFGCEDLGRPDLNDSIGAFGKCVRFHFFDGDSSQSQQSRFLACIRATRADFCGNGVSLTNNGTPYAIYPPPLQPEQKRPEAKICTDENCWEATWNKDGATCLNHRRYLELLYLAASNVPKVWSDVTTRKYKQQAPALNPRLLQPEVVHPFVEGPMVYERPAVGAAERARTTLSPNLLDALATQNVLLNCPHPSPVLECLKQFTTYYYDDTHWMWWLVDVNPVDSVAAQVVCKPQYSRKEEGAVITRTAVRIPNSAGSGYDTRPCCDTLGDCAP
jgi:hypothetical protein